MGNAEAQGELARIAYQRDYVASLGPGWPARRWSSRTYETIASACLEPEEWSDRLVRAYAPPVAKAFLDGRVYDPFVATFERPRATVGRRLETPYRATISAAAGVKEELIDELWSICARGYGILPPPGDLRKFISWVGHGGAKWYDQISALPVYDVVIVTPRYGVGGGEKVVRNLALAARSAGRSVLVLVADAECGPSAAQPDITLLCLSEMLSKTGLAHETGPQARSLRLVELLKAVGPDAIIVVNSAIATYGLKRDLFKPVGAKIFYAFFSRPIDENGVQRGFYLDLPWLDGRIDGYISDNNVMAQALASEGIDRRRIGVLPIPTGNDIGYRFPLGGRDILWCSRMDPEKRPELLLKIAEMRPELRFRVYGLPLLGNPAILERVKAAPNIDFRGGFDAFSQVDRLGCAAFLYTSAYDGMPNVVLEAMQGGLPVVATGVGGVPEALQGGRGISLRVDAEAVDYCRALDQLVRNLPKRLYFSIQAVRHVRKHHSYSNFRAKLWSFLSRHGVAGVPTA